MAYLSDMNDYRGIVVGIVSSLVCAASGCSAAGFSTAVPAGPPTAPTRADPASPTGSQGRPSVGDDPTAPPTYVPVRRSGKPARQRLPGNPGKLEPATIVSYDDGVKLRVKLAARHTEQGSGPGVFPGRALTVIRIALTNKSRDTVDLTQVVVTTTYGHPARIASPVYPDTATADFRSWVKPGGTATAQYAFAVADESSPVTIIVDWDGTHAPAVFTGRAG